MSDVVIIDSGGANLASLQFALERLGASSVVSSKAAVVSAARRVLLPGVGAATAAMARLRSSGLDRTIPTLRQPLLGICLGMQLLYERSEEGDTPGLGIVAGSVTRIARRDELPVPHMGWNDFEPLGTDPLLHNLGARADQRYVYFVHSYAAAVSSNSLASTTYGESFTSIVRRDNFWGVQFHPERSAAVGAQILQNFLQLT